MEPDELLRMSEKLSKITPEWLAGFFDGEGCVCSRGIGKDNLPCLKVNLTQSNYEILFLVSVRLGGSVSPKSRTTARQRKECFELAWVGKSAIPILEFIKDHVVVKKAQVDLALDMVYHYYVGKGVGKGRGRRIPEDILKKRTEIADKISKLNNATPRGSVGGVN